jgi:hypothetical protein
MEVYMTGGNYWKFAMGGVVAIALITGAFLFPRSAPAGPTVTVYKTPT